MCSVCGMFQESLVAEREAGSGDDMDDEQTWPTDEEIAMAQGQLLSSMPLSHCLVFSGLIHFCPGLSG